MQSKFMRQACCSLLVGCLLPQAALGQDLQTGTMEEFRETIQIIAKGVAKVLAARRDDAITIGTFSGPASLGTAAGPGIKQLFAEELRSLNIRVAKLGTPLGLSGEYRLSRAFPNAETTQVQFEVKLTDDSGQSVADLASMLELPEYRPIVVDKDGSDKSKTILNTYSSPESTALAMGLTVDFDGVYSRRYNGNFNPDLIDVIKEATSKPTAVVLNGNELRASRTSAYGLQVFVNGKARAITIEDGRPFVAISKGEIFKLQVNNRSPLTISTIFTLDGINSFTFSEIRKDDGKPKYTQWIVPPQQVAEVFGWHITNSTAREFKVTDFSESAAALVSSEGSLGTITVVIRATWRRGETPPRDELMEPGAAAGAVGAIGFGEDVSQRVNEDAQAREYGRVRSILTIRYNKPE